MHIVRSQNSSRLVYNCMVETITSAIVQSVLPLTATGARPCLKMENKNLWETSTVFRCYSNVAKFYFRNIARHLANRLSLILSIWISIFFLVCGYEKHFGSACNFKLHWAFRIHETTDNAILWCQTAIWSWDTHIPSTVKMPRKMMHGWWSCLNKGRKKKKEMKQKEKRTIMHDKRSEEDCVKILGVFTYLKLIWNCLHPPKHLVPKQSFYKKYLSNLQVMTFIGYVRAYFLSEIRYLNGFLFSKSKWFQKLPSQQNILSTLQRLQF